MGYFVGIHERTTDSQYRVAIPKDFVSTIKADMVLYLWINEADECIHVADREFMESQYSELLMTKPEGNVTNISGVLVRRYSIVVSAVINATTQKITLPSRLRFILAVDIKGKFYFPNEVVFVGLGRSFAIFSKPQFKKQFPDLSSAITPLAPPVMARQLPTPDEQSQT